MSFLSSSGDVPSGCISPERRGRKRGKTGRFRLDEGICPSRTRTFFFKMCVRAIWLGPVCHCFDWHQHGSSRHHFGSNFFGDPTDPVGIIMVGKELGTSWVVALTKSPDTVEDKVQRKIIPNSTATIQHSSVWRIKKKQTWTSDYRSIRTTIVYCGTSSYTELLPGSSGTQQCLC